VIQTVTAPTRWITRLQPRPNASLQIVCLPSAGAGASMYRHWPALFGEDADVLAVALPGRESRPLEASAKDLSTLARRIVVHLLPVLDRPYVLFGHSMGALLAYEISRVLPAVGGAAPRLLVLSAVRPPDTPRPAAIIDGTNADLVTSLSELGGIPAEVLENEELLTLLLEPLRADLMAVSTFQPLPGPPPTCPVLLIAGADDEYAPLDIVAGWRRMVDGPAPLRVLPGDHFYLRDRANLDALRALLLGPPDMPVDSLAMNGDASPDGDSFTVEPFDGDVATLEQLSLARLPDEPVVLKAGSDLLRLGVREDGRLIGYAECGPMAEVDDKMTYHLWVLVHPDVSRRGLGRRLLIECRKFARERGGTEFVTAVDRNDAAAARWLAVTGFQDVGDLDIQRRAAGPAWETSTPEVGVEAALVNLAGQDDAVLAAAAAAINARPLPDGTSMAASPDDVHSWYFAADGTGTALLARAGERLAGIACVQRAQRGGLSIEPLGLFDDAPAGTLDALLAAATGIAAQTQDELVTSLSTTREPHIAAALARAGFQSVGGRRTWRLRLAG